jgi:hypothetical protein
VKLEEKLWLCNNIFLVLVSVNVESQLTECNEAVIWNHEYFSFALLMSFHQCIILTHLSHALES